MKTTTIMPDGAETAQQIRSLKSCFSMLHRTVGPLPERLLLLVTIAKAVANRWIADLSTLPVHPGKASVRGHHWRQSCLQPHLTLDEGTAIFAPEGEMKIS